MHFVCFPCPITGLSQKPSILHKIAKQHALKNGIDNGERVQHIRLNSEQIREFNRTAVIVNYMSTVALHYFDYHVYG